MKKVSILIVNWNGLKHLEKCLPTLSKITYKNHEVIMVDNGSVDNSIEYVSKNYPKVKIVRNKINKGFSGGNNSGLPYCTGDYILLLNNDTIVKEDFVTELVRGIEEDPSIGVVQGKLLSMDHPGRLDSVGAFFTNTGFLYHYGYFQKDQRKFNYPIYLYTAKGACLMAKKEVISKVGLFDDDFFAYFEETDFCHRVWLAGYTIKYVPESQIYHLIGGTSNTMKNAFIQFHSFKNRINSYIKNLSIQKLILVLPLHLLLCEFAAVGFLVYKKPGHFIAVNKAILWNITNINKTLKKRTKVQKLRVFTDAELAPLISKTVGLSYYYYLFAKSLVGYTDPRVIKR